MLEKQFTTVFPTIMSSYKTSVFIPPSCTYKQYEPVTVFLRPGLVIGHRNGHRIQGMSIESKPSQLEPCPRILYLEAGSVSFFSQPKASRYELRATWCHILVPCFIVQGHLQQKMKSSIKKHRHDN